MKDESGMNKQLSNLCNNSITLNTYNFVIRQVLALINSCIAWLRLINHTKKAKDVINPVNSQAVSSNGKNPGGVLHISFPCLSYQ